MNNAEIVDVLLCHFPGCARPADAGSPGVGRPGQYCDDPAHDRGSAWRARKAAIQLSGASEVADLRPVDAARERASAIRGQVAGMIDLLQQQLAQLVAELHTMADPDVADAHIQSVKADAAASVAVETARATRAEESLRDAQILQAEAEAAAEEATAAANGAEVALAEAHLRVAGAEAALTDAMRLLDAATADAAELRENVAASGEALTVLRVERDSVRADLAEVTTRRDMLERELSASQSATAALTVERDSAVVEMVREKEYAAERIMDLRSTFEGELERLRGDLGRAQREAREQRTRADIAEAHTQ